VSRGITHNGRPVAIWLGVTGAAALAAVSVPATWAAARSAADPDQVPDLLVALCATALAASLAWLWVVTTVTVAGLVSGTVRGGGGTTRRLVLVACGIAVIAGTSAPAVAAGGDGPELLVGLPLPERAVAPARVHHRTEPPEPAAPGTYVVRAGDSLWSIARSHPVVATSVDDRWRAIWQANRDVVGDDPDLIHPGQALSLPTLHPTHDPHSDGDR
jgi:nucleoid-associated protein YgaU